MRRRLLETGNTDDPLSTPKRPRSTAGTGGSGGVDRCWGTSGRLWGSVSYASAPNA
jgi:hypothetical protein